MPDPEMYAKLKEQQNGGGVWWGYGRLLIVDRHTFTYHKQPPISYIPHSANTKSPSVWCSGTNHATLSACEVLPGGLTICASGNQQVLYFKFANSKNLNIFALRQHFRTKLRGKFKYTKFQPITWTCSTTTKCPTTAAARRRSCRSNDMRSKASKSDEGIR